MEDPRRDQVEAIATVDLGEAQVLGGIEASSTGDEESDREDWNCKHCGGIRTISKIGREYWCNQCRRVGQRKKVEKEEMGKNTEATPPEIGQGGSSAPQSH